MILFSAIAEDCLYLIVGSLVLFLRAEVKRVLSVEVAVLGMNDHRVGIRAEVLSQLLTELSGSLGVPIGIITTPCFVDIVDLTGGTTVLDFRMRTLGYAFIEECDHRTVFASLTQRARSSVSYPFLNIKKPTI